MPSPLRITPSGISLLLECPRCMWLQFNEDVKRPRGIFPSLPDGMDNVFKKYFDEFRAEGTLPPEIEGRVEGSLFTDLKKLNSWRDFNFGRGGLRAEVAEYNITVAGAIDELLISPDGLYIPFDFKTRGYPTKEDTHEHYRSQLDMYAFLFERNKMPPANHGYLLFFWPDSYHLGTANFKTDLVKMDVSPGRALSLLKKAHEIIIGPKPSSHSECEYCLYRGI